MQQKPHSFSPCVELFNGHQQDAQEAASAFLDSLRTMLKRAPSQSIEDSSSDSESDPEEIYKAQQNSVINDYFLGFFSSTVSCRNCGESRTTTDAFASFLSRFQALLQKKCAQSIAASIFFRHWKLSRRRT